MEPQPVTTPPSQNTSPLPAVPDPWQGGFKLYKYSKQAMKRCWPTVVILYIIVMALSFAVGRLKPGGTQTLVSLIIDLVSILFSGAIVVTLIAAVRGVGLAIGDAFKQATPVYLNLLLYGIISGLIEVLSLILFIVPFFFVAPRLALGTFFVVDKRMGALEALRASWSITKGSAKKVWGIWLASIAMGLLAITIIGIPFSFYFLIMYAAAPAVLYEFLTTKQQPVTATDPNAFASAPTAPVPPANTIAPSPAQIPPAAPVQASTPVQAPSAEPSPSTQPPQPPATPTVG